MMPYLLGSIIASAGVVSGQRHAVTAWIATAVLTLALGRDFAGWLRGRTQRTSGGPTAEPS
jgi:hypothetical protein